MKTPERRSNNKERLEESQTRMLVPIVRSWSFETTPSGPTIRVSTNVTPYPGARLTLFQGHVPWKNGVTLHSSTTLRNELHPGLASPETPSCFRVETCGSAGSKGRKSNRCIAGTRPPSQASHTRCTSSSQSHGSPTETSTDQFS